MRQRKLPGRCLKGGPANSAQKVESTWAIHSEVAGTSWNRASGAQGSVKMPRLKTLPPPAYALFERRRLVNQGIPSGNPETGKLPRLSKLSQPCRLIHAHPNGPDHPFHPKPQEDGIGFVHRRPIIIVGIVKIHKVPMVGLQAPETIFQSSCNCRSRIILGDPSARSQLIADFNGNYPCGPRQCG